MAVDAFNSVGGYTVGIPPIPIISDTGNLTVANANIGNIEIPGDANVVGTVTAGLFVGDFQGNIVGNIVVPGETTWVLYNENGNAQADAGLTFDSNAQLLTVSGDLIANSVTMGSGTNEFSTTRVLFASTASSAANQILHTQVASSICSVDYTVIATDTTANTRQTSKLFASVLGTEVGYFEYGTIDVPISSPGVGDFRVSYSSGNVVLTVTPVTSHIITYKIMVTSYKE
jgi:hypothetical protein